MTSLNEYASFKRKPVVWSHQTCRQRIDRAIKAAQAADSREPIAKMWLDAANWWGKDGGTEHGYACFNALSDAWTEADQQIDNELGRAF